MENIKEILSLCGADVETVMERFLDDEEFYTECIITFLQDRQIYDELKTSLDNHDLNAAFNAAHNLKGVTANLGLINLYNAVCNIIEPLRLEKDIDYSDLCKNVIDEFNDVEKRFNEYSKQF